MISKLAVALAMTAVSSHALAQQARYLSEQEIINRFSGRTMMWEDYQSPEKPAAIVHYTDDGQILIMYDGKYVPNDFSFAYDGKAICWRQPAICRSFRSEANGQLFVVDSAAPEQRLAEVTHVANDADGSIFQKIGQLEQDHPSASTVARSPAPAQSAHANSGQWSTSDTVVAAGIGILLLGALAYASGGHGSDDRGTGSGGSASSEDYRYRYAPTTSYSSTSPTNGNIGGLAIPEGSGVHAYGGGGVSP